MAGSVLLPCGGCWRCWVTLVLPFSANLQVLNSTTGEALNQAPIVCSGLHCSQSPQSCSQHALLSCERVPLAPHGGHDLPRSVCLSLLPRGHPGGGGFSKSLLGHERGCPPGDHHGHTVLQRQDPRVSVKSAVAAQPSLHLQVSRGSTCS